MEMTWGDGSNDSFACTMVSLSLVGNQHILSWTCSRFRPQSTYLLGISKEKEWVKCPGTNLENCGDHTNSAFVTNMEEEAEFECFGAI